MLNFLDIYVRKIGLKQNKCIKYLTELERDASMFDKVEKYAAEREETCMNEIGIFWGQI